MQGTLKVGKCEVTIRETTEIRIVGQPRSGRPQDSLPCAPDDEGLVEAVEDFIHEKEIFPLRGTGGCRGGGVFVRHFSEKDASVIVDWLKEKARES